MSVCLWQQGAAHITGAPANPWLKPAKAVLGCLSMRPGSIVQQHRIQGLSGKTGTAILQPISKRLWRLKSRRLTRSRLQNDVSSHFLELEIIFFMISSSRDLSPIDFTPYLKFFFSPSLPTPGSVSEKFGSCRGCFPSPDGSSFSGLLFFHKPVFFKEVLDHPRFMLYINFLFAGNRLLPFNYKRYF